ncbi:MULTISPECIES: c-type cytochrome [Rhodopseudomonas]|uniref:Cytochrome C n=1 Tax=Rhodopseudomonas palustris TaxID=1076 RepID=A0A0D7EN80_RHOPL|nr:MULTISPECIES: c-type cytochrome [Rhodopseudomonas]KIZ40907.1 cytochrome C [Rhodopseudomonas palustris]MDF3812338.1 c-type cytochrome [Rhodopseudomonas sp. BAL398]WOK18157.1 c-type cytochrome [Rhodopseudomonas sp. BAL398]
MLLRSAALAASLLYGAPSHAVEAAKPPIQIAAITDDDAALIKRGEYVARLGDCVACHTAPGGAAMAGGRELATPFGKLYSTNITPDPKNGIGSYSFEQFDRAVRHGVAADGHNLYPAMPYPSYAKTSDADMRALFAYLSRDLAPIDQANKPAAMNWPFSMRWGLSLWNLVFLDSKPFQPDANHDAVWNRGAYLVQGLGHCGACHTPRGIAFQEKAMSDKGADGKVFLAGETVESWRALSLRDLWTVEQTKMLLKTGQNDFATVSGGMTDVIHNSTQHFTDADLTAIATYLKSLPAGDGDLTAPAAPLRVASTTPPAGLFTTRGGLGYVQFCVDCHRQDGAGVKGIFPPLSGNLSVTDANPATLLHLTLTGWKTAETATHPRVYTMPGFSRLSDQELAEIVSFVRDNWGNHAKPVTATDVKKMRAELDPKVTDSSTFDTPRLADMLTATNPAQVVRGMRLHLETKALLPDHVGDVLNCTSCHLNVGTVADGSPFVGVSAFFPSYQPRGGRIITLEDRINGCFQRSMNGKPLANDSDDMKAMVAYFDWMKRETKPEDKVAGRGVGKIDRAIKPNVDNGKVVYATQCAVCHGKDGEGLKNADGRVIYPPLWGAESFNIGAGMARTYTAAAFVKRNMPVGFHEKFPLGQGGLSDQEAVDVAEYFTHQPRPDFPGKVNDWPKGKKPSDARY